MCVNPENPFPQNQSPATPPSTSGHAIGSLVCGILSLFSLGITGFIGVVLGHISLSKIKKSSGTIGGHGLALAGLITSYIGIVIFLIVVVIFGGAIFAMRGVASSAKNAQVDADFRSIESALEMYKLNAGNYPTTDQGLKALVEKPSSAPVPMRWAQIMSKEQLDAWKHPYGYRFPGTKDSTKPEIISKGPDGIEGNADDLSSQSK
jgi:general secretion pathway protein G